MIYVGIDPGGKSGAMCIMWESGEIEVLPFDEIEYIAKLKEVAKAKDKICCLERVTSMPQQGVSSTFAFGCNFGWTQGVLEAFQIPYELVRPQKWKSEFGITADKNTSIEVCKRLFPEIDLRRTERCRKDDDGKAEAVLMSLYAKRRLANAV